MLSRNLASTVSRLSKQFPIVAITGPRQSGKTTLARMQFPDKTYVTLEDPLERTFAEEDPRGFLARFTDGAIFDEAQRWPDLFSHLQGMVDADRIPGRFVLTGSQQFGLMAGISQSLAGRVGMTHLLPLALDEIPVQPAIDPLLSRGGYPALHAQNIQPTDWFVSYVATYVERDVRQLLRVQDLSAFQRFLRLCAGRVGQLLNLSALGEEAGITHATARAWLSLLETSYLVFLLPPYHRNFGKRLIKTPKLYFVDTGLAAWLLGMRTAEQLTLHPMRGALFENLIVGEFLKARYNAGQPADLYFWRDNNGLEADLLFEDGERLQTVEIKSGATVTADSIRAGQRSNRFAPDETNKPWLVHGGIDTYQRSGVRVIGWRDLPEALTAMTGYSGAVWPEATSSPAPTFMNHQNDPQSTKSGDNLPEEHSHDPATTSAIGAAPESLARESSGYSQPASGISRTDSQSDAQFDGAGAGTGGCSAGEATSGSTRPLDATRELQTAAGVLTYSVLAERLAVNIARYLERLLDGNPGDISITSDWIRSVHQQLAGELFPDWAGRYRTTDVQVGTHFPPASHDVAVHIENYCCDLAERLKYVDDAESVTALLAWADWRFQWIHPFKDFNGRVGRILLVALCYKLNLPPANPAADEVSRNKYFNALREADRGGFSTLNDVWMERLGA